MQNGETFKFDAQLPMFRDAGIKRTAMPQSARCAGIVCRTRLRRPSARQGATNSTLAGSPAISADIRQYPAIELWPDGGWKMARCRWSKPLMANKFNNQPVIHRP